MSFGDEPHDEPIESKPLTARLTAAERSSLRAALWSVADVDPNRAWSDHAPSVYLEITGPLLSASSKLLEGLEP